LKDFLTIGDFTVNDMRILMRVDINSPMDPKGNILDDKRFRSHLETLRGLEDAKVVLLAHQSRAGKKDFTTLEAHSKILSRLLHRDVAYVDDIFGSHAREVIKSLEPGEILLLENTRFYSEENINRSPEEHANSHMVRRLAPLFDLYINDAFAVSHRSHLSVVGFTEALPSAAGLLMEKEIDSLDKGIKGGEHPSIFVLGGTKADDSIKVIQNVLDRGGVDQILVTGVVGTVFQMASGIQVGEKNENFVAGLDYMDQVPIAKKLLEKFSDKIVIPKDVALDKDGDRLEVAVNNLPKELQIADIGLETIVDFSKKIKEAKIVVMNGTAGIFEQKSFALGTIELLQAATEAGFSIAGGGHTSAAIEQLKLDKKFSHVSTGGGASITYLSGDTLPGIEALKRAAERYRR
jgi:phosphoglycerate kinase